MPEARLRRRKTGGRVARVSPEAVRDAGRELGLAELSVPGVAEILGVSPAAVYRHVPNQSALVRLVGESVLADLVVGEEDGSDAVEHLVYFARRLREFVLAHPGSAVYLRRRFPRGAAGIRLLEAEVGALGRRGYPAAQAIMLSSAVAGVTLGQAETEELRAVTDDGDRSAAAELAEIEEAIAASPLLLAAHLSLPALTDTGWFELLIRAVADGLVRALPADGSLEELVQSAERRSQSTG